MNSRLCKLNATYRITAAVTILLTATLVGCRVDYGDVADGGGGGDFLTTGRTLSFFDVHQVDPRSEDSAGPQFVVAADLNQDGLMDLVSAWNQSQPVQIHLQYRTTAGGIYFETTTLAGNIPVVAVAGKLGPGYRALHNSGLTAMFSTCPGPLDLSTAKEQVDEFLADTTESIARLWQLGKGQPLGRSVQGHRV